VVLSTACGGNASAEKWRFCASWAAIRGRASLRAVDRWQAIEGRPRPVVYSEDAATRLLVFSQVVLSLQLPFAVYPLCA
jgi:hypothetical protein